MASFFLHEAAPAIMAIDVAMARRLLQPLSSGRTGNPSRNALLNTAFPDAASMSKNRVMIMAGAWD